MLSVSNGYWRGSYPSLPAARSSFNTAIATASQFETQLDPPVVGFTLEHSNLMLVRPGESIRIDASPNGITRAA